MSRWSPDRSSLLSLLLDEATGTQEAIAIRQDFAMMWDCLSQLPYMKSYFTGSKAEGLDLPGSDRDYMFDINDMCRVKVIQSKNKMYDHADISSNTILYLRTENVNPGFALLEIHRVSSQLLRFIQRINGVQYLSSNLMVQHLFDMAQLSSFGAYIEDKARRWRAMF